METGGQRFVMKNLENAWYYKEDEWNGMENSFLWTEEELS